VVKRPVFEEFLKRGQVYTSDKRVRLLMQEKTKHGKVGKAAMKAEMDRNITRRIIPLRPRIN